MNRNTKLEECGAGFRQETPTGQESVRWVRFFFVCVTFYKKKKCLSIGLKREFVSALRRGVGADGVEQHAADGGQRPEQTLREKRADRS